MTEQRKQDKKSIKEIFETIAEMTIKLKVSTGIEATGKVLVVSARNAGRLAELCTISEEDIKESAVKLASSYELSTDEVIRSLTNTLKSIQPIENKQKTTLELIDEINKEECAICSNGLEFYYLSEKEIRKKVKYAKTPMESKYWNKVLNERLKSKKRSKRK